MAAQAGLTVEGGLSYVMRQHGFRAGLQGSGGKHRRDCEQGNIDSTIHISSFEAVELLAEGSDQGPGRNLAGINITVTNSEQDTKSLCGKQNNRRGVTKSEHQKRKIDLLLEMRRDGVQERGAARLQLWRGLKTVGDQHRVEPNRAGPATRAAGLRSD